jgi:chromosome segregation ATPase
MFKDSGDGTVDAAKVLVKALEEKVFKKLEFVDTRYKKDAVDNLKTKNNVDNLLPNFEKMKQNIEKIMENLEKNNEEADNNKREFDEQKNEIKNIIDDKNDILKNIENLKNDIDNIINTKLNDLDKKIEDLKKNSNDGTSELFKIGFGNQGIDEEMMQVMEKKISDLRKKTNDIENTMKLKNKDIEEIQNEVKDIKAILDKKITREDLKELYNLHLSDVDEINDLKDNAGMTFDEIRKTKNEITNILQKIDNINGNIVLLQNSNSLEQGKH